MKKRIFALLLAVATVTVMFTGCLGEDGEPKASGEGSSTADGHKHVFAGDTYDKSGGTYHYFTCEECGESVREEHEYTYFSEINGHYQKCACGKTKGDDALKPHIMSNGKCTKCGWSEDPNHTHSFVIGEQLDVDYHSVSCECGKNDKAQHDYAIRLNSDTDMHYYDCRCGWKSEPFPHATHNETCDYCDEMGLTHYCEFTKKGYDEDGHFLECECGERSQKLSHEYESDYNGKPYMIDESNHSLKCKDCDYVRAEKHSYELIWAHCGSCGHEKPESVGLEFEENGNGYTLIDIGSCKDTFIVIPSKHNGKNVTAIGPSAFEGNTDIVCVVVPEGVKLGSGAFAGCTALKAVKLPEGTGIRDNAFAGCTALEVIECNGVTNVEMFAFTGCKSFKGFTSNYGSNVYYLPVSVYVGDYAFKGCESLALDVLEIIGDGNTYIGAGAFSGTSIKSLIFSSNGEQMTISGDAFSGCKSLKTVTIRNYCIEYFDIGTFSGCTALEKLSIGYGDKDYFIDIFAESTVDEEMGLSWYDGCPDFTVEFVDSPQGSDEEVVVESIKISALYDYINETYWQ